MPRITFSLIAAVIGLALTLPSAQASRTAGDVKTSAGSERLQSMAPASPGLVSEMVAGRPRGAPK